MYNCVLTNVNIFLQERVKKLQETEKKLDGSPGLVKANREYVTEGKIWVVSPTSGKPKLQYLFVVSNKTKII